MLKYSLIAGPLHFIAFFIGLQFGAIGVAWSLTVISWALALPILIITAQISSIPVRQYLFNIMPSAISYCVSLGAVHWTSKYLSMLTSNWLWLTQTILACATFTITIVVISIYNNNWRSDMRKGYFKILYILKSIKLMFQISN
jgi:hypothetical protein